MTGRHRLHRPTERSSRRGGPPGLALVGRSRAWSALSPRPASQTLPKAGGSSPGRWSLLLPLCLLLPASSALTQGPALSVGDLPGITIERSVTYKGKALYG